MKTKKTFYYSTTFATILIAAFVIINFNNSAIAAQQTYNSELNVVSTSPSDGDTDVARNEVLEITFSEEVDSHSFNSDNFTLMQGREEVTGTFEFSDKTGMFTTEENLKANSVYTATFRMNDNNSDFETEETFSDNKNSWSFTTGGNSERVESINLGRAGEYVLLTQSNLNNERSSDISGETGFGRDSENNDTIYWLKNEDIDREQAQRDTTADRNQENRSQREDATNRDRDSNEDNMDQAFDDMKSAYSEAEERSPVDFVDFRLSKSHDQFDSRNDYNRNDNDNDHNMNPSYSSDSTMQEQRNSRPWPADADASSNRDSVSSPDYNTRAENNETVTLEPGIYKWDNSVEISENLTLSGSDDDVWIFQISDDLTLNREVKITLSDGAQAGNIFWKVAGNVNLEESSHFEGIILSNSEITMKDGASLNGRILTQENISLENNTVREPQTMHQTPRTRTIDR